MAAKKSPSSSKAIDFEKQLSQLEALVSDMEKGEMSLEDSLKAFEQGIQITRQCQQALAQAEQKVAILTRGENGELSEQPFDPDNP
ncbi:exodeoxyribonuclease VII small subunit [Porticoccus sp. GXU_MW_L64]